MQPLRSVSEIAEVDGNRLRAQYADQFIRSSSDGFFLYFQSRSFSVYSNIRLHIPQAPEMTENWKFPLTFIWFNRTIQPHFRLIKVKSSTKKKPTQVWWPIEFSHLCCFLFWILKQLYIITRSQLNEIFNFVNSSLFTPLTLKKKRYICSALHCNVEVMTGVK